MVSILSPGSAPRILNILTHLPSFLSCTQQVCTHTHTLTHTHTPHIHTHTLTQIRSHNEWASKNKISIPLHTQALGNRVFAPQNPFHTYSYLWQPLISIAHIFSRHVSKTFQHGLDFGRIMGQRLHACYLMQPLQCMHCLLFLRLGMCGPADILHMVVAYQSLERLPRPLPFAS